MDTKHLITFVTFAEEKSYIRAAMKLNYAASTLGEHIGSLEQELQVKLVESHGKRTVLTKAGLRFLPYAREMLSLYKRAAKDMATMNMVRGQLRVMAVESLGLYGMSSVFARFMAAYPDVTLSISIGNCNDIYDKLHKDEIDAAYVYDMKQIDEPDLITTPLFTEPLCFVCGPSHPLARRAHIVPEDFSGHIFVLAQKDCYYAADLEAMLRAHDVKLKNKLQLDSGSLIKKYICDGYGIGLLPKSVIREEETKGLLNVLDVEGVSFEAVAQIVILRDDWILPSVEALVAMS